MRKRHQVIQLFFAILSSSAIVFSSAYFGPKAFGNTGNILDQPKTKSSEKMNQVQANNMAALTHPGKPVVIHQTSIVVPDLTGNLHRLIERYPKINLPAQSTFSFLTFLKKENLEKSIRSEEISLIGSLVYQTILPSNFIIQERNISNQLPPSISLGYESKVSLDQNLDFSIYNPNKTNNFLQFQFNHNLLSVALMGTPLEEEYRIRTDGEETYRPKTIIQYSPGLLAGQIKIVTAGENGKAIKVYKDIYKQEQLVKTQLVAEDFYPPVYRVEIHPFITSNAKENASAGPIPADNQPSSAANNQSPVVNQIQTVPKDPQVNGIDQAPAASAESDLWGKPDEQPK